MAVRVKPEDIERVRAFPERSEHDYRAAEGLSPAAWSRLRSIAWMLPLEERKRAYRLISRAIVDAHRKWAEEQRPDNRD